MANLVLVASWTPNIYQIEESDAIDAGIGGNGIANLQAMQIGNSMLYLYGQLNGITGGTVTGTTQSLFDSSTKFATDAFVFENLGRFATTYRTNATGTLDVTQFGFGVAGTLCISDALPDAAQVLTLTSLATLPPGACVHFKNESNYLYTLTAYGSELFVSPSSLDSGLVGQASLTVSPGCDFTIVRSQTNSILGTGTPCWHIVMHSGNLHAWKTPTFAVNWASTGGAAHVCRYRKKGNYLELSGDISAAVGTSLMFTIASGYYPKTLQAVPASMKVAGTWQPTIVTVDASGNVSIDQTYASAIRIWIDGLTIPLD